MTDEQPQKEMNDRDFYANAVRSYHELLEEKSRIRLSDSYLDEIKSDLEDIQRVMQEDGLDLTKEEKRVYRTAQFRISNEKLARAKDKDKTVSDIVDDALSSQTNDQFRGDLYTRVERKLRQDGSSDLTMNELYGIVNRMSDKSSDSLKRKLAAYSSEREESASSLRDYLVREHDFRTARNREIIGINALKSSNASIEEILASEVTERKKMELINRRVKAGDLTETPDQIKEILDKAYGGKATISGRKAGLLQETYGHLDTEYAMLLEDEDIVEVTELEVAKQVKPRSRIAIPIIRETVEEEPVQNSVQIDSSYMALPGVEITEVAADGTVLSQIKVESFEPQETADETNYSALFKLGDELPEETKTTTEESDIDFDTLIGEEPESEQPTDIAYGSIEPVVSITQSRASYQPGVPTIVETKKRRGLASLLVTASLAAIVGFTAIFGLNHDNYDANQYIGSDNQSSGAKVIPMRSAEEPTLFRERAPLENNAFPYMAPAEDNVSAGSRGLDTSMDSFRRGSDSESRLPKVGDLDSPYDEKVVDEVITPKRAGKRIPVLPILPLPNRNVQKAFDIFPGELEMPEASSALDDPETWKQVKSGKELLEEDLARYRGPKLPEEMRTPSP